MRISGTEPSSVILSHRTKFKKFKSDSQNMPKQAKWAFGSHINCFWKKKKKRVFSVCVNVRSMIEMTSFFFKSRQVCEN